MKMKTKQEFIASLPQNLSKAEKTARWEQHQAAEAVKDARRELKQIEESKAKLNARVSAAGVNQGNLYLRSLVDPEGIRDVGVPDEFYAPTARIQTVLETKVEFDADGKFACIVRPDINGTLLMSGQHSERVYTAMAWNWAPCDIGTDRHMAAGSMNNHFQEDVKADRIYLPKQHLADPAGSKLTLPFGRPIAPENTAYAADGRYMYDAVNRRYNPIVSTGQYFTLYMEHSAGKVDITSAPITANVFYEDLATGVVASMNLTMAFRDTTQEQSGQTYARMTVGYDNALPYFNVKLLYVQLTSAGVGRELSSVAFSWSEISLAQPPTTTLLEEWHDMPDAVTMRRDFTAYRPVSMSCLITYFGNMLANDLISARLVSNGSSPFDVTTGSFTNQGDLAEQPVSYSGPLQKGAYGVWAPRSIVDATRWRDISSRETQWDSESFLAFAGEAPPDARYLRIRIVLNIEAQTNKRLYHPSPYLRGTTAEMEEALRAFALFTPVGENNAHLERIRRFLKKKALPVGTRLLKELYNNRKALVGGAMVAGGAPEAFPVVAPFLDAMPNWD